MNFRSLVAGVLIAAVTTLFSLSTSYAADGSWSAATGGGNWSDTTKWTGGTVANDADFTATFGNVITANSIITLDSNRTIGNITASDTGQNYTISSAVAEVLTLDDAGIPTINVTTSGRTLTINSQIDGNEGLEKTGAGILVLGGTNIYTGGTTIAGGTVDITSDANLGAAGTAISFTSSGTLRSIVNSTLVDLGSRSVSISGGATATFGGTSRGNMTTSGAVTGAGGVTMTSGSFWGKLSFTSTSNTFTGAITANQSGNDGIANVLFSFNSIADSVGAGNIILNAAANNGIDYGAGATAALTLDNRQIILANANLNYLNNASSQNVTINTAIGFSGAGARSLQLGVSSRSGSGLNTINSVVADNGSDALSLTANAGNWSLANAANTFTGSITVNTTTTLRLGSISGTGGNIVLGTASSSTGTLEFIGDGDTTSRQVQVGPQSAASGNAAILNNGMGAVLFTASTFNISDPTAGGSAGNRNLTLGGTYSGGINEIQGNIVANTAASLRDIAIIKTGAGSWKLSGNNTYTKTTVVQEGNLIAGNNAPGIAGAGAFGDATTEVTLGVAGGNSDAGILVGGAFNVGRNIRLLTNNTTDPGTRVLTLGGNTAANSEFSGNVFLGTTNQAGRGLTLTAALGGQVTFSGVIQNPTGMDATTYTVTKAGQGTVILTNANTYTGATSVNAGTLLINNTTGSGTGSGAVTVGLNAILGGNGIVGGAVTVNGTLAPGNSPDVQTYNAGVAFNAGSTFAIDVLGPNVGDGTTGYDSALVAGGNVSLDTSGSGVALSIASQGGIGYAVGDRLWIIDNTGGGTFTGTFAGLPTSGDIVSTLTVGGLIWEIHYNADKGLNELTGGNDVVLVAAVPEPQTIALSAMGLLFVVAVGRRRKA